MKERWKRLLKSMFKKESIKGHEDEFEKEYERKE